MSQRLNYYEQSPVLSKKLYELGQELKKSSLGDRLIKGCGFCLDMHCKEAKIHGEHKEVAEVEPKPSAGSGEHVAWFRYNEANLLGIGQPVR